MASQELKTTFRESITEIHNVIDEILLLVDTSGPDSVTLASDIEILNRVTLLENLLYERKHDMIESLLPRTNNNQIAKASNMHPTSIKAKRVSLEKA